MNGTVRVNDTCERQRERHTPVKKGEGHAPVNKPIEKPRVGYYLGKVSKSHRKGHWDVGGRKGHTCSTRAQPRVKHTYNRIHASVDMNAV